MLKESVYLTITEFITEAVTGSPAVMSWRLCWGVGDLFLFNTALNNMGEFILGDCTFYDNSATVRPELVYPHNYMLCSYDLAFWPVG